VNLRGKREKQQREVEREEEESSSNRPELENAGGFMLGTYLSDKKNSWKRRRQTIRDGYGRKYAKSQLSDQNQARCNQQGVGCAE